MVNEKTIKDLTGKIAREFRVHKNPNHDAVCFHARQGVEKYLKALLQEAGLAFGKTHNLVALLDLLVPVYPEWELHRPVLQKLNLFAVVVRYPGESANRPAAKKALELSRELRAAARNELNLKV